MSEHPILFAGSLVRAILSGQKTQTRRLIAPSPDGRPTFFEPHRDWFVDGGRWCRRCPYGVPGDRLWVRETWAENDPPSGWIYRADDPHDHYKRSGLVTWRPSIHMPRKASRLKLEVTDVRVQRLNSLTDEEALAEGITHESGTRPAVTFATLWDSLYAKRGFSWQSDPWVWALAFRRV
jgi:hypothetical protein